MFAPPVSTGGALSQRRGFARSLGVTTVGAVPFERVGIGARTASKGLDSSRTRESDAFEAVFRERFDELHASLFRYLDRLSGDPALAADIAQESLVRLFQRGRMPDDLRAWLVTVAHNRLRTARRLERRRAILLALRLVVAPPDPPPPADRAVDIEEQGGAVRAALASLPPRDREMLVLRSEGYSYREIGRILHMRESSVGTLLRRAKIQFVQALGADTDAHA